MSIPRNPCAMLRLTLRLTPRCSEASSRPRSTSPNATAFASQLEAEGGILSKRELTPLPAELTPDPLLWRDYVELLEALRSTSGYEAKHHAFAQWAHAYDFLLQPPSVMSHTLDFLLLGTAHFRVFNFGDSRMGSHILQDVEGCMYHPFGPSMPYHPPSFALPDAVALLSTTTGSPDIAESLAHAIRPPRCSPPKGARAPSLEDMYKLAMGLVTVKNAVNKTSRRTETEASIADAVSQLCTRAEVEAFLRSILGSQRAGLRVQTIEPLQLACVNIGTRLRAKLPSTPDGAALWGLFVRGYGKRGDESDEDHDARQVSSLTHAISPRGRYYSTYTPPARMPAVAPASEHMTFHATTSKYVSVKKNARTSREVVDLLVDAAGGAAEGGGVDDDGSVQGGLDESAASAIARLDDHCERLMKSTGNMLRGENSFPLQLAEVCVAFNDAVRLCVVRPAQRLFMVGSVLNLPDRVLEQQKIFRLPVGFLPGTNDPPISPEAISQYPPRTAVDAFDNFANAVVDGSASRTVRQAALRAAIEALRHHPMVTQFRVVEENHRQKDSFAHAYVRDSTHRRARRDDDSEDASDRSTRAKQFLTSLPSLDKSSSRASGQGHRGGSWQSNLVWPQVCTFRTSVAVHRFPGLKESPSPMLVEPKLDGERLAVHIRLGEQYSMSTPIPAVTVMQRAGRFARTSRTEPLLKSFYALRESLRARGHKDGLVVLDGEVLAMSKEYIMPFSILGVQKREEAEAYLAFFAFDILFCCQQDMMRVPLLLRRAVLEKMLSLLVEDARGKTAAAEWAVSARSSALFAQSGPRSGASEYPAPRKGLGAKDGVGREVEYTSVALVPDSTIALIPQYVMQKSKQLDELYQCVRAADAEGLIVKCPLTNYLGGQRRYWSKLKPDCFEAGGDTVDLVVVGGVHGVGKNAGLFSSLVLAAKDAATGELRVMCCSAGLSQQERVAIQMKLEKRKTIESQVPPAHLMATGSDGSSVKVSGLRRSALWLASPPTVEDGIVVEVQHMGVSEVKTGTRFSATGYSLRFPRVLKVRDDKTVKEATDTTTLQQLHDATVSARYAAEHEASIDVHPTMAINEPLVLKGHNATRDVITHQKQRLARLKFERQLSAKRVKEGRGHRGEGEGEGTGAEAMGEDGVARPKRLPSAWRAEQLRVAREARRAAKAKGVAERKAARAAAKAAKEKVKAAKEAMKVAKAKAAELSKAARVAAKDARGAERQTRSAKVARGEDAV